MVLAAALAVPQLLLAQTREVTGMVTIAGTDVPLGDAMVSVVGTNAVARTAPNGTYRIVAPDGPVTLNARAIGYKRATVSIAAGVNSANFALERDVLQLEGVVVTGQATTVERQNATVAVSTVNAEQLTRVPAQALESALQGKVVGARINMNSGAPGGGGQIQIRGVTTILGNGEPLYVVDGVIISNAQIQSGMNSVTGAGGGISGSQDNATNRLADINPNNIESVEILKGAAASAIYGSRATNGVVVITTKRGKVGRPQFNLTQRVGTYDAVNLLSMRRFQSRDEAYDALVGPMGAARARALVDSVYALNPNPYHDYLDELYGRNPLSYETTGTLTGGSEGTRYFLSASTKSDGGIMENTGARQDGLRMNLDQTLSDKWSVSAGANFTRSQARRGISNNDNSFTSPLYNFGYTPSILDLRTRDAAGNFPENPVPGGGGSNASNPFQTMAYLKNTEDVFRQIGSARINFSALQTDQHDLQLSVNGGVDRFNQTNDVYSPNLLQFEPGDGFPGTAVRGTGNSLYLNGSLNAVYSYSPRSLPLTARTSAGLTQEIQNLETFRIQARGLIPGIELVNQGNIRTDNQRTRIVDEAVYLQEEISGFDDRLNINLGVRADRSSANGDQEKYFIFPKASAAYTFFTPVSGVERLKFRAAVGQSGNRPQYGVRDITLINNFRIDGNEGLGANGTLGNPNVEPERMTEQEYGLDATFVNDRLALEATYFDRNISNLYLQAPLAQSTGLTQQIFNGGEMRSKGIELGLTMNPIRDVAGINWVSRVNYFTIDQKVTELPVPNFLVGSTGFGTAFGRVRIAQGASTTAIWGNAPFMLGPGGDTVMAPLGIYVTDRSKVLFRRDTIIGDATPDFEMSFGNEFTWKGLSLNMLAEWRKGGQVSNLTNNLFDEGQTSYDFDDVVQVKMGDGTTVERKLGAYRYDTWAGGADARAYVQDGSYVKLREVTLSYLLPASATEALRIGARDLRLSVSGRNLFTWSDYWGMDPEVNNFGNQNVGRFVDLAPFPPSRSVFISVDVGF